MLSKLKTLYLIILFIGNLQVFACSITSNEYIVFLNTNNSINEIASAKESACKNNKHIKIIPELSQEQVTLVKEFAEVEKLFNDRDNYSGDVQKLESRLIDLRKKVESIPKANKESLSLALVNIKSKKGKVETLIASGHDGGGKIGGHTGRINKSEIIEAMNENKIDFGELKNLLLWGCYTTTQIEIAYWKTYFPDIEVIAGFVGSGPSDSREASYELMGDILNKSHKVNELESENDVLTFVQDLKYIDFTFAGVFLDPPNNCNREGYLFSTKEFVDNVPVVKFGEFSVEDPECAIKDTLLLTTIKESRKYYYGSEKIPASTSSGKLREIYNIYLQYGHCPRIQSEGYRADQIGLLLFYDSVAKNFYKHLQSKVGDIGTGIIDKMKRELENVLFDEKNAKDKNKELINKLELSLFQINDILTIRSDSAEILNQFDFNDPQSYLNREDLTHLLHVGHNLEFGVLTKVLNSIDEEKIPHIHNFVRAREKIQKHLFSLECLDFQEWHEVRSETLDPQC